MLSTTRPVAAPAPTRAQEIPPDALALLERINLEIYRRECKTSFKEFAQLAWPVINPAPLKWGWYAEAICAHLEEVEAGRIRRLIVNLPPRMAKSFLVSILWPAWVWLRDPTTQFICASHSAELAGDHSVECRSLIESEWYTTNFSIPAGWALRADQNQKNHFKNSKHGQRLAVGVTAHVIGHGADIVIFDDLLDPKSVASKAERDTAIRFMSQVASTRFNDPSRGRSVLIMQRLHEDDPTGYALQSGGWEHLRLPSEFEPDDRCVTYHFGESGRQQYWTDPRSEPGELLFPDRFPPAVIAAAKQDLRLDGYAAQHQQRPMPLGGGMFANADWRFWRKAEDGEAQPRPRGCWAGVARLLPTRFDQIMISVDATFKKTESGSYVAMHVWGSSGGDRYLLDREHGRWDFVETCQRLTALARKWPHARKKVIEAKANGEAIVAQLSRKVSGLIAALPDKGGDKESRAHAFTSYVQAGNVFLPDGAPWLEHWIAEFAAFPRAGASLGDDDVDAMGQAFLHLEQKRSMARIWAEADMS